MGDIPVIGWLFRNSRVRNLKTNLMIFLTPHIIHGAQDLANVYQQKIKDRDIFMEKIYGSSYKDSDFYASLPKRVDGLYKENRSDYSERTQREEMLRQLYQDDPMQKKFDTSSKAKSGDVRVPTNIYLDGGGVIDSQPTDAAPAAKDGEIIEEK